jgi:hypothetical protein
MVKLLSDRKIVFFVTFLFCSSFIGCVDNSEYEDEDMFECDNGNTIPWYKLNDGNIDCTDGSDENGQTKVNCDETKPVFSNEQENVVADYVYRFRAEDPVGNPYGLHLTDNGSWDSSGQFGWYYEPNPYDGNYELRWGGSDSEAFGIYNEDINNYDVLAPNGICDFEILETEDTGRCVDNANSITYVKISYNMQHPGQQYSLTQMEGYYTVAKSNINDEWGIFLNGDFPMSYDCTFAFQGIPDHSIDSDNDGINDISEIKIYSTNSTNNDTDRDGINDYDELFVRHTNPLVIDTDNDGLTDFFEIERPDLYENTPLPLVFDDGLVGYWPFNENEGDVISDYSGYQNSGTFKGGFSPPGWTEGKEENALKFDGDDDHVVVKSSESINSTGDTTTILMWLSFDYNSSSEKEIIFEKHDGVNGFILTSQIDKHDSTIETWDEENQTWIHVPYWYGQITLRLDSYSDGQNDYRSCYEEIYIGETSDQWSKVAQLERQWHHIGVTLTSVEPYPGVDTWSDSYAANIFLNGKNCANGNNFYGRFLADSSVVVGNVNNANFESISGHNAKSFGGKIDEMAIWNRTLNDNEIVEIYNNGDGPKKFALDPLLPDTDGDGLSDYEEINVLGSDPLNYSGDLDNDGVTDSLEFFIYNTDPNNADSDDDGLSDGDEIWRSTASEREWTFCSEQEQTCVFEGTKEIRYGQENFWAYGTFAEEVFCSPSIFVEGEQGGHNNCYYYSYNPTNPNNADTDGDGVGDADDLSFSSNHSSSDNDGDGLENSFEINGYTEEKWEIRPLYSNDIGSYWMFDEGEGTTVSDKGYNENHASLDLKGPSWVKGIHPLYGSALEFDGMDDEIKLPNSTLLSQSGTISLWMKLNSITPNDGFAQVITGGFYGESVRTPTLGIKENGKIMWELGNNINNEIDMNFEDNNWYYIVFTWGTSLANSGACYDLELEINVYINGGHFDEGCVSSGWNEVNNFQIGSYDYMGESRSFFNGTIDDVAVWERALNQSEINDLYYSYNIFRSQSLDPNNADTDGDGLDDKQEIFLLGSNPFDSLGDLDKDGISDNIEFFIYHTDHANNDTDGDGIDDYSEIYTFSSNPLSDDTDNDGLNDFIEVDYTHNGNGLSLSYSTSSCSATLYQHSGFGGWSVRFDAGEYDTNGLTAYGAVDNDATCVSVDSGCKIVVYDNGDFSGESYILEGDNDLGGYFNDRISSFKIEGLNDNLDDNKNLAIYYDSDGDGLSDGEEFVLGTNLLSYDSDGDGLSDGMEVLVYNTNATNFDSDDDGVFDFDEIVMYGTNPNQNHDPVVFFKEQMLETKDWFRIEEFYKNDDDGDYVADNWDNCKDDYNPDQWDADNDGQGDSCETSYNSGSSSGGYSSGGSSSSSSDCDALMYYDDVNDVFYLYDPCTGQMVIV